MPASSRGPWLRKGRGWYVEIGSRQVFLGKDEAVARQRWLTIFEAPPDVRGLVAARYSRSALKKHRIAKETSRVLERAAAKVAARSLGLTLEHRRPRAGLPDAIAGVHGAQDLADRIRSTFRYIPDGWATTAEDGALTVWFVEVEYTSPMRADKLLAYDDLARRLLAVGVAFRLIVADRYGADREIDIQTFAECMREAAREIRGEELPESDG